jgi:hypothetical protein
MSDDVKRQIFQSCGQFIAVVVTGLIVYKDFTAFLQTGVLNALWQPTMQGILSVLAIWGISRLGPQDSGQKLLASMKKDG